MPTMEVADVMVNLGGDTFNSVSRTKVTAAEIAVLQAVHGNDAVFDIKPLGKIERRHGVEKARLLGFYKAQVKGVPVVEIMFPGIAARVFERLNELALDDSQFWAERRGVGGSARQAQIDADRNAGLELTEADITPLTDEETANIAVRTAQPDGPAGGEDLDELESDDAPADDTPTPAMQKAFETHKALTAAQKRAAAKAETAGVLA